MISWQRCVGRHVSWTVTHFGVVVIFSVINFSQRFFIRLFMRCRQTRWHRTNKQLCIDLITFFKKKTHLPTHFNYGRHCGWMSIGGKKIKEEGKNQTECKKKNEEEEGKNRTDCKKTKKKERTEQNVKKKKKKKKKRRWRKEPNRM